MFFIAIFVLFKLLGRVILPLYIRRRIRKTEVAREKAYHDYINRQKRDEGKVTIDNFSKTRGRGIKKEGEYVDFEEVK